MQIKLGVYAADARAANVVSTRRATYLYGIKPIDGEHIKRLVWREDFIPCIDAIEPGAFNHLTELEYIDINAQYKETDFQKKLYRKKFPKSYCGLLWQSSVTSDDNIVLICCPQRYFQSDANVDFPGVPQDAQSLSVGAYGFYNVKFRKIEPIITDGGMQQFSFSRRELPLVNDLGDCSFANTNITRFTIWPELCHIGMYAFMNCHELTTVNCLHSDRAFGLTKISSGVFYNCDSLEEVTLPEGVIYIGPNAFANCKHLKCVRIPASLSCICRDAFKGCENVRVIIPPNSRLKHIGIQEHVYLAGEPNLAINTCSTTGIQLEYYRNNYAIQNIVDIAAVGGNLQFEGENSITKLPRVIQNLQRG